MFNRLSLVAEFSFIMLASVLFAGCPAGEVEVGPAEKITAEQPAEQPAPATAPKALPKGKEVAGKATRVPFILWGGDMATFYGNGGLKTTEGSVFDQQGLIVELTPGDDFDKQISDYKAGTSPFLRGTFRMIGLASEKIADDPGARPMVFMQMTWSSGDHLITREGISTMDDLKGKTIAVQKGGPHVGMLDDVLKTAHLGWDDVTVVWADQITGPGSATERFRKGTEVDAAFAITPDMLGLTGGLESTGSGAEGTVKGAQVLVSTAEFSRSIADVYAVRKDFWESNPKWVTDFSVAYLKSVEEVVDLKSAYEASGSEPYMNLLQLSQNIWGKDAIPTLEEDAHGLLSDCAFAGYPGNVAFFTDAKNRHGFADFNTRSLDLATGQGYAKKRVDLLSSPIPWEAAEIKSRLSKTSTERTERFDAEAVLSEVETLDADGVLDSRTLLSFTISFEPNQTEFDASKYAKEYARVFELADRFGNAAVVIRGHSATTLVLRDAVKAGLENGDLKRSGTAGNYQYFLGGRPLDIEDPDAMVKAIQSSNAFRPVDGFDPRKTMAAALNLSRERAGSVRESVIRHAADKGVRIDESQLQGQGVGIREPLVARPRNPDEAAMNMRVEFRLVRVSAEAITASDFDF